MGANAPRAWLEGAGLLVLCLAVASGIVSAIRRDRGARLTLMLASAGLGLPLLMAILRIDDRFYARNLIAVLPLVAALAAPAMLRLRALPLAVYLALALVISVWVATDWRYEQPDWRAAIWHVESADPQAPVIAVTRAAAPVVRTYLRRGESSPAGLVSKSAWVLVEPTRGAHERALVPAPAPVVPGFSPVREQRLSAFRLILVSASAPTHIASGAIPGSTVFPGTTATAGKVAQPPQR